MSKLVCVGQIVNVHGIKGTVKIKPNLMNPRLIASLGTLTDKTGNHLFRIVVVGQKPGFILAQVNGISDRTAAEKLKGVELYAPRDRLPAVGKTEIYYVDLIGLCILKDGKPFGRIHSVENYGAGDIVEIKLENGKMIPFSFTQQTFQNIDLNAGTADIHVPEGMEEVLK